MLKARVLYYNQKGFGHIALMVKDLETNKVYFYDWGGTHSLERNKKVYGDYIVIDLPDSPLAIEDFLEGIADTDYAHLTPRNFPEDKTYNLLSYNCAHAVQQLLHHSGYLEEQPVYRTGLRPDQVAQQAAKLAIAQLAENRAAIMAEESLSDVDGIQQLIDNTIARLEAESTRDEIVQGGTDAIKSIKIEALKNIKYDGSFASVNRLFEAAEFLGGRTAKELQQCIQLLNPELAMQLMIRRLKDKAQELNERGYPDHAAAIQKIIKAIEIKQQDLASGKITPVEFKQECSAVINQYESMLAQHRGFKQLFVNILLVISKLMPNPMEELSAHKAMGDTRSSKLLTDLNEVIDLQSTPRLG
jgi:hypothetical protein